MVGKFTVRINGQEVKSPTLRFAFLVLLPLILLSVFLAVLIILIGPIGIIVGPVVLVALILVCNFILQMSGRHGFIRWYYDGNRFWIDYHLDFKISFGKE